jgi:hypothetical protein
MNWAVNLRTDNSELKKNSLLGFRVYECGYYLFRDKDVKIVYYIGALLPTYFACLFYYW